MKFLTALHSFLLGVTSARIANPPPSVFKRYHQFLIRFNTNAALLTQNLTKLNKNPQETAALSEILNLIYLGLAVIKNYQDETKLDLNTFFVIQCGLLDLLYKIQKKINNFIKNTKNAKLRYWLFMLIFPVGRNFSPPSQKLIRQVANASLNTIETETPESFSDLCTLWLDTVIIQSRIETAKIQQQIAGEENVQLITAAIGADIISPAEAQKLQKFEKIKINLKFA